MASVINVIIMLNLLISILGDSFDLFQIESEMIDCMEMAESVLEIETLMYWKKDMNQKMHLQICKKLKAEKNGNWAGKINAIFESVEKNRIVIQKELKDINKKLSQIQLKIK